jgi:hypothetical protein
MDADIQSMLTWWKYKMCRFFECECARCRDRTEFGLLFSAHVRLNPSNLLFSLCSIVSRLPQLCQECGGTVLPETNELYCPGWRCESCPWQTTAEAVEAVEHEIEQVSVQLYNGKDNVSFQDMFNNKQENQINYDLYMYKVDNLVPCRLFRLYKICRS